VLFRSAISEALLFKHFPSKAALYAEILSDECEADPALTELLEREPEAYLHGGPAAAGPTDAEIEALIAKRTAARRNRDWALSDQIRDALQSQGIVLEDGPNGTTWRRE